MIRGGSPIRTERLTPRKACSARRLPNFWAYNPAYAQVQNTNLWSVAWADIMRNGMTPEAAADKAFKQIEAIFAKYPIVQS